jgi:hypothetical protein
MVVEAVEHLLELDDFTDNSRNSTDEDFLHCLARFGLRQLQKLRKHLNRDVYSVV